MRKAAWIAAMALTAITGLLGLLNGPGEIASTSSALQQSVAVGVLLYGVLGVVSTIALFRRRQWSVGVVTAWAIVITYVATVASFAFSDPRFQRQETWAGVISAFVATLLIGAFVIWVARTSTTAARVPKHQGSAHIPPP